MGKAGKEAKKGVHDKQIEEKKFTFRGLSSLQVLDAFIVQGDEFPHQILYTNST
jgi:hypothetical protein